MKRFQATILFTQLHFQGSAKDLVQRFTWEGLQTLVGWWVGLFFILRYKIQRIEYADRAIVVQVKRKRIYWGGISFGTVIFGDKRITAQVNNALFMHEFGHCLQSRLSGPLYLFKYGLPSLRSAMAQGHFQHPVEQDANRRARWYFSRKDDFQTWPMMENPILQQTQTVKLNWWEYIPPIFPLLHLIMAISPAKRIPADSTSPI